MEKPWKKWPESVFVWFRKVAVALGVVEDLVVVLEEVNDDGVVEGVDVGVGVVEFDALAKVRTITVILFSVFIGCTYSVAAGSVPPLPELDFLDPNAPPTPPPTATAMMLNAATRRL